MDYAFNSRNLSSFRAFGPFLEFRVIQIVGLVTEFIENSVIQYSDLDVGIV